MDFTFSEDQLLFRDSVRDFLSNEVTPENIRARWETETGQDAGIWSQLAELGLSGILVPEDQGGLGMDAIDFVLLAEECGRAALPEPLVTNVLVASTLLQAIGGDVAEQWLAKVATGESQLAIGKETNGLVADARGAELLLLNHNDEVHAVAANAATITAQESVDPSRRLYTVDWTPGDDTRLADASAGSQLWAQAVNYGALGAAAQMLGLAQRMVEMSVAYTADRQQFGKPIGSFQAVKHLMSNVAVATEFAKAPVYRAAYSLATADARAATHVSHAKIAAAEAATLAAKNCIQVHGAMGYTWEVDLQIFMKRAWALDGDWGSRAFHKARLAQALFADKAAIGAGETFAA